MIGVVRVPGVVLRGGDLNFAASPWRSISRANNLRVVAACLTMCAAILAVALFGGDARQIFSVGGLLVFGWLVFIWLSNGPFMAAYRAAYVQSPLGEAGCDFAFDLEGMKQVGPGYQTSMAWSCFVEVVEDNTGFLLWLTPFSAVKLPIRYLDDVQFSELRALVLAARERGDIKGIPE